MLGRWERLWISGWISKKGEKFSKWYCHVDVSISLSSACIQPPKLANTKYSWNFQYALLLPLPLSAGTQPWVTRWNYETARPIQELPTGGPLLLLLPSLAAYCALALYWLFRPFAEQILLTNQAKKCCIAGRACYSWCEGEAWEGRTEIARGKGPTLSTLSSSKLLDHFSQVEDLLQTMYLQIRRM